jgi:N-acyl-D-aspartate/D-glutamate deacylase
MNQEQQGKTTMKTMRNKTITAVGSIAVFLLSAMLSAFTQVVSAGGQNEELMLAISKMTYMPARFLEDNGIAQMANKGRIKVGADADITIFDPKTVRQNATPANGGLASTGIPYVVVNGTIVVKDSKVLKDVFPGKPIRLPIKN